MFWAASLTAPSARAPPDIVRTDIAARIRAASNATPRTMHSPDAYFRPSRKASTGRYVSSCRPSRRPGRFWHRGKRPLSRSPREEVVDHELIHLRAGIDRSGAEMREQHDVLHRQQISRNLVLEDEHVHTGGHTKNIHDW